MKNFIKKNLLRVNAINLYLYLRNLYWKKTYLSKLKKLRKTGKILPPYDIILETNYSCNLRCFFCFQKKEKIKKINEVNKDDIEKIFVKIGKKNIRSIMIMGGESFVKKDIFEIFNIFEKLKLNFNITTNGTLLDDKKINKLIKFKYLKSITFSVHGDKKTHDKIVNMSGAYKRVLLAIKTLNQRTHKIYLAISAVITKDNVLSLKKIIDNAVNLNVKEVVLALEFSQGIYEEKETNKLFKNTINNETIIKAIKEVNAYSQKRKIILCLSTNLMLPNYINLFSEGKILENKNKINLFCEDLFKIRIDPQGRVVFCLLFRRVFGDLKNNSLTEAINNKEIKMARKKIALGEFINICEHCCKLNTFN